MFYVFLLAHLVADFMLQPFWLVQRKRYWDGLLIHGGLVLVCMLALMLIDPATWMLWPAMLGITAVHIAADWWKVNLGHKVPGPPIVSFLLDQVIHVVTISVALLVSLAPDQVWSLAGSTLAPAAVYIAAYIVAAMATPIGVMVWLDPAFKHVALAGRARIRCLLAGSAVVSLSLIGGVVALPATLFGLAMVSRRPFSVHPLDTSYGLIAVLCVAGMMGTLLAIMR